MVSGVSFIRFYFKIFRMGASTCLQLDPNGNVRASKLSVLAAVPVLAIIAYNSYQIAVHSLTLDRTKASLAIVAVMPPILLGILCTFGQLMNLRPLSEAMNAIALCDKHLKLPWSMFFYPLCEFLAIIMQNALAVSVVYDGVLSMTPSFRGRFAKERFNKTWERDEFDVNWNTFKIAAPMLIEWSFIFSSSIQYCCFVNTIGHFFYRLNRKLPSQSQSIKDSLRCYHSLVYASQIIDECYGPIMLVVFGSCFALIGNSAIGLMQKTKQGTPIVSALIIYVARMIPLLSVLVPLPLYVAHMCEKTANEAGKFNVILNELALSDMRQHFTRNELVNLHFSSHKPLSFTACQCFEVNYKLAIRIIAALTAGLLCTISMSQGRISQAVEELGGQGAQGGFVDNSSVAFLNSSIWDAIDIENDGSIDLDFPPFGE